MPAPILTINGGSSSIKFALFETKTNPQSLLMGSIDRIGSVAGTFSVEGKNISFSQAVTIPHSQAAATLLSSWLREQQILPIAIGYRVVHGGPRHDEPIKITPHVLRELERWSQLDPEHLPEEIFLIKQFQKIYPSIPQIACFDTAFHHDLPRVAQLLPIPRRYEAKGVRRYGFHGLSCTFLMQELKRVEGAKKAQGKVILAHLGHGASLTAVHHGKSIDTTMGFSPTSGIMMGSRSGDLDPALISFFSREEQMQPEQFQEMVNKKSGLLGVSEISSDLRDLLACEKKDSRAAEAIELFCYQIKKQIGAFAAALHGLDILVFSGGIGEHAPLIRRRICDGLGFLGIELDEKKNQKNHSLISSPKAKVQVHVIPTNEELIIAQSTLSFL